MSFFSQWGGGINNTSGHSSYHQPLVTEGYGFPVGNLDTAGGRPVRADVISIDYVSGATGVQGLVGYNSSIQGAGGMWDGIGGGCSLRLAYSGGTVFFGRNTLNGLTTVDTGDGSSWVGGMVGGLYWSTSPAAPTMLSAVPGPGGTVTVQFSGNSDGGSGITGWVLQWADNPGFANAASKASTGTDVLSLEPGKTYWFRAAGRNSVVDSLGRYGAWSGAIAATMQAGGQIYDGSAFAAALPFIETAGANSWSPALGFINTDGLNAWSPIG